MHPSLLALALAAGHPAPVPRARDIAEPVAPVATAWYDFGHRLVVRIAELRLDPTAARAVRELLGGQSLTEASFWADRIRRARPSTSPLHFVNIPLNAGGYDSTRHCPRGRCIIAELERDRRVLADPAAPRAVRREALRFLIHLMGDLHQPLHVSNNRDRGGNLRRVYLFGEPRNLHQVWDGDLIQAIAISEDDYFERLKAMADTLDLAAIERGSITDWVMEAHRTATDHAYRLPTDGRLGDEYLAASIPEIDLALVRAGVRLGRVLNELFGKGGQGGQGGTGRTGRTGPPYFTNQ